MPLSATPPSWLKGRSALNAWRRCVLYESSLPKRQLELLTGYIEAVTTTIRTSTEINEAAGQVEALVKRSPGVFGKADLQADLRKSFRNIRFLNSASEHLPQLVQTFEKELLRSADQVGPELRSLISAIVPAGRSALRKNESSRQSITVKKATR